LIVTWARPRRSWPQWAANSPRTQTNSRWPPRRWRSFRMPTPSCHRILMVSWTVPSSLRSIFCLPLVGP
jgi:hypothetical protein